MNRVRQHAISLDIFSDKVPWLASGYGSGKTAKISESVKTLLKKIITNELTPLQKEIINDYYYLEKSVTEIAEARGVNKSSVSRCLKSARERIGRSLKYGQYRLWDEEN